MKRCWASELIGKPSGKRAIQPAIPRTFCRAMASRPQVNNEHVRKTCRQISRAGRHSEARRRSTRAAHFQLAVTCQRLTRVKMSWQHKEQSAFAVFLRKRRSKNPAGTPFQKATSMSERQTPGRITIRLRSARSKRNSTPKARLVVRSRCFPSFARRLRERDDAIISFSGESGSRTGHRAPLESWPSRNELFRLLSKG